MGVNISAGDLLTTRKLKNTDATSHLHIDQRNTPSAEQIRSCTFRINKINKKNPQYAEKNRRPKKWRFARSFDGPGIALLLVGGSKSSFISWSKLKITWLGKWYVWTMCSSCFLNNLISVEKNTLHSTTRSLFSAVPPSSNHNCSYLVHIAK